MFLLHLFHVISPFDLPPTLIHPSMSSSPIGFVLIPPPFSSAFRKGQGGIYSVVISVFGDQILFACLGKVRRAAVRVDKA